MTGWWMGRKARELSGLRWDDLMREVDIERAMYNVMKAVHCT